MNRIIVATDYSPEAENAMFYAATACKELKYEIVLFHVEKASIHAMNGHLSANFIKEQYQKGQEKLEHFSRKIQWEYDVPCITYYGTGDFMSEMHVCIKENEAQMVVMGMPEKSLEQSLMGDTTTKVLHSLKIPTLAIPSHAKYQPIKNILFSCDILRGVHKIVYQQVAAFAKKFDAKVEVFYVGEEEQKLEDKAQQALSDLKATHSDLNVDYKSVVSDELIDAIKAEVESFKADILVMVPYKYGFWGSMVHRSKTQEMAAGNDIPLLSIPL